MIKLTELLVFCMPFIKLLLVLLAIVLATRYLFTARSRRRWITVGMRLGGSVMILPLVLGVLLFASMASCSSRPRVLISPDARHVAEYKYEAGFLGRDATYVMVRKKWSILPDEAYGYLGPSDWSLTEVSWIDNSRLRIRYYPDTQSRYQVCNARAAGVVVECVRVDQK
jgi:hypothetical protein